MMIIVWFVVEGVVVYDVEWKKDSGNWICLLCVGMISVDVIGIYVGGYLV